MAKNNKEKFDDDFDRILELVKIELEYDNKFLERLTYLTIGLVTALVAISKIFDIGVSYYLLLGGSLFLVLQMMIVLVVTDGRIWRYIKKHYEHYEKFKKLR